MENIKNFFFQSFAVSFGLFVYTILIYFCYLIFFNNEEDSLVSSEEQSQQKESKEKLTDMDELDFLEDAEENV